MVTIFSNLHRPWAYAFTAMDTVQETNQAKFGA